MLLLFKELLFSHKLFCLFIPSPKNEIEKLLFIDKLFCVNSIFCNFCLFSILLSLILVLTLLILDISSSFVFCMVGSKLLFFLLMNENATFFVI